MWQHAKLQALYLQTSIVSFDSGVPYLEYNQYWAGAQRVVHGCTGGTVALVRKQVESLGCTVRQRSPGVDRPPSDSDMESIVLWLYTADGGPDQQGFCLHWW